MGPIHYYLIIGVGVSVYIHSASARGSFDQLVADTKRALKPLLNEPESAEEAKGRIKALESTGAAMLGKTSLRHFVSETLVWPVYAGLIMFMFLVHQSLLEQEKKAQRLSVSNADPLAPKKELPASEE